MKGLSGGIVLVHRLPIDLIEEVLKVSVEKVNVDNVFVSFSLYEELPSVIHS